MISVMREIKNFFEISREKGKFTIEDQTLTGFKGSYPVGSYIALTGSILNKGVYLLADNLITLENAKNEAFDGIIYQLAPPPDFLALVEKIKAFNERTGVSDNVVSAKFGIESFTRATNASGNIAMWQDVFKAELSSFRRMRTEVRL